MPPSPALLEMIRNQPAALEALAERDLSQPAETLAAARRVFVVGTGSSHHAAELGAQMLAAAGLDARPVTSATFAGWTPQPEPADAVVLISHTAESAYPVRVRRRLLDRDVSLVSITGVGGDWPEAIQTVERERSQTYTVSYLAALGVIVRLAQAIRPDAFGGATLADVAAAVRGAIAAPPTDVPMPARLVALAGAGPWATTAREGALKMREAARLLAEGYEAEALLHGFAVPLSAADTLVLLQPGDDPDGLVAALGRAATAEGVAVATLTDPAGLPPLLGQFPMTARLQLIAAEFARVRGQNPDVAITGAWDDSDMWRLGSG
jgi:glucosamine--fructose-6-phosphate aminotransferase (isomerizing)